jgi:hypothetical protein
MTPTARTRVRGTCTALARARPRPEGRASARPRKARRRREFGARSKGARVGGVRSSRFKNSSIAWSGPVNVSASDSFFDTHTIYQFQHFELLSPNFHLCLPNFRSCMTVRSTKTLALRETILMGHHSSRTRRYETITSFCGAVRKGAQLLDQSPEELEVASMMVSRLSPAARARRLRLRNLINRLERETEPLAHW